LKQSIDFDFLKQDTPDLIRQSRDGITRIRDIVQKLKDFSQTHLSRAMDSTLTIVLPELRDKADVRTEYEDVPEVWCVPSQITQVFLNLLINAGQAITGKEKGKITIRIHAIGDQVAIDIGDTGVGIPADIIGRIFDPFFTTRDVGAGAGLGLSIAYGIVETHRGVLSVQSTPGAGSTFRIMLPVHAPR
jgi:two-component system NtrC family sensor kinase